MKKAAVILCGGMSLRMGSDKAFLPFGETTLLKYQISRFSEIFEKIYISGSSKTRFLLKEDDLNGCVFVEDLIPEKGPMGGLYSCMKAAKEDILFFTSVDSPFTDLSAALRLCEGLENAPDKKVCAVNDISGKIQPLFCAYSKKCLPDIEKLISEKNFKLRSIAKEEDTVIKDILLPEEHFFNMNNTKSYYQALKTLAERTPSEFPPGFIFENRSDIPVISFSAGSGTGKTTYLEKLIPMLKERGVRIAVIKHDAHGFEIDKPGKDSYRLRAAGADQVILSSADTTAAIVSHIDTGPSLRQLISGVKNADLIITEGYKFEKIPKICLLRKGYFEEPASLENVIAFAADFPYRTELPVFDLNRPEDIVDFIMSII